MKFKNDRPIYIQIEKFIRENILKGKWGSDDRVPSIRELAVDMEVNPNTVMRAYSELQDQDIIYNKRGIGYFINENARKKVMQQSKKNFLQKQLPQVFNQMELLNINFNELEEYYREYETKGEDNETIK
ncbi:MAG: GntR family transcriptional regulator [Candidatus Marinimicrobia bacterium]|nr:GntR family transcriptional regulator [Candidatus Neomarinimicrobiota bacterium]